MDPDVKRIDFPAEDKRVVLLGKEALLIRRPDGKLVYALDDPLCSVRLKDIQAATNRKLVAALMNTHFTMSNPGCSGREVREALKALNETDFIGAPKEKHGILDEQNIRFLMSGTERAMMMYRPPREGHRSGPEHASWRANFYGSERINWLEVSRWHVTLPSETSSIDGEFALDTLHTLKEFAGNK